MVDEFTQHLIKQMELMSAETRASHRDLERKLDELWAIVSAHASSLLLVHDQLTTIRDDVHPLLQGDTALTVRFAQIAGELTQYRLQCVEELAALKKERQELEATHVASRTQIRVAIIGGAFLLISNIVVLAQILWK